MLLAAGLNDECSSRSRTGPVAHPRHFASLSEAAFPEPVDDLGVHFARQKVKKSLPKRFSYSTILILGQKLSFMFIQERVTYI